MKRFTVLIFFLMLVFVLVIPLVRPSLSEQKEKQTVEGKILCVEADQQGQLHAVEKPDCKGVSVVVGSDGKLYALSGADEKAIEKMAKEKKVIGQVVGNQRAWTIYAASLEPGQKPVEKSVKGTLVCLLPNYENASVTPVIATGPCSELPPHAHVVYTEDGQVYALEGSEEAIHKIETNPNRENVTVKGKLQGNPGGWIIFVE